MAVEDGGFSPSRARLDQGQDLADYLIGGLEVAVQSPSSAFGDVVRPSIPPFLESTSPFPMTDVEANLATMVQDFKSYVGFGSGIPCLRQEDGDLIPISMRALFDLESDSEIGPLSPLEYAGSFGAAVDRIEGQGFPVKIWKNPSSLRGMLRSSLSKFLACRIASIDFQSLQPIAFAAAFVPPKLSATTASGTLAVSVNYQTSSMRVHSSPAYFLNWKYYGSSPSPVAGNLPPGLYKFAGDSASNPSRIIDSAVFSIPSDFAPVVFAF